MDTLDWILVVVFTAIFAGAGYFALPPYGALLGAALAVFLIWRAKKNRDRLRSKS